MVKNSISSNKSKYKIDTQTFGRPIEWTPDRVIKEREAFIEYMQDNDHVFFDTFAHLRGYTRDMLRKISEKDPDFSRAYKVAKEMQPQRIVEGALKQKFNGHFAQFLLRCNHGFKEPKNEDPQTEIVNELQKMREDLKSIYENNPQISQPETD